MAEKHAKAIEIFFSYAHEDKALRQEIEKQLRFLERQGLVSTWSDHAIQAGQEWGEEIDRRISTAQIILLLISPSFIASDYCYSREMLYALERHKAGEARVIPIIIRPVYWQDEPFGKLQVLPTGGKPVSSWPDIDEAFLDIARNIRKVVKDLLIEKYLTLAKKLDEENRHLIMGAENWTGP